MLTEELPDLAKWITKKIRKKRKEGRKEGYSMEGSEGRSRATRLRHARIQRDCQDLCVSSYTGIPRPHQLFSNFSQFVVLAIPLMNQLFIRSGSTIR